MHRKYMFVCDGLTSPIIGYATSKDDMRAHVRDTLGWPSDMALPRHACVAVA